MQSTTFAFPFATVLTVPYAVVSGVSYVTPVK